MTHRNSVIWAGALTLVLALGVAANSLSDTVYLRDGEQASGKLLDMTKKKISLETPEGTKTFNKKEVLKLQLQQERLYDDVNTADAITEPELKACLASQPKKEDYPAAGYVTLLEYQTYDARKPGIVIDTTRRIVKVLQQRGEEVSSQNVWYFEDTDAARVDYALTVTPEGRVLHLDDSALKNESLYAQIPDYRRLARIRFACKEPRSGSILDMQYTVDRKREGLLDPFYAEEFFREDQPILRKVVEVLITSEREAELMSQVDDRGVIASSREVRDGVVHLLWTLSTKQEGLIEEPLMPPLATLVPKVIVSIGGSWDAVSTEYAKTIAPLAELPADLAAKAKELASKGGPEAIYNFVTRSIRTVPVPQNQFRFVPRAAADTAKRGLANELDKNLLYYAMLRGAGLDAQFALLRSRERGPLAQQTPSVRAFDRSAVRIGDAGLFATTAIDLLPFNVLPGVLHGAPAFVIQPDKALLTNAQQVTPADEQANTRFDGTLGEDGSLKLKVTYTGSGNESVWIRAMKDLDQQQLRNQAQQWVGMIHPGAVLDTCSSSDLADLSVPASFVMECTIPDYATAAGGKLLLFTLPCLFYDARDVGRPQREYALYWEHVSQTMAEGTIKLPAGFKVYSMPGPVEFDSNVAGYVARVAAKDGEVQFNDSFVIRVQDAPREAYPDVKNCMELRARVPMQRIILTRK